MWMNLYLCSCIDIKTNIVTVDVDSHLCCMQRQMRKHLSHRQNNWTTNSSRAIPDAFSAKIKRTKRSYLDHQTISSLDSRFLKWWTRFANDFLTVYVSSLKSVKFIFYIKIFNSNLINSIFGLQIRFIFGPIGHLHKTLFLFCPSDRTFSYNRNKILDHFIRLNIPSRPIKKMK